MIEMNLNNAYQLVVPQLFPTYAQIAAYNACGTTVLLTEAPTKKECNNIVLSDNIGTFRMQLKDHSPGESISRVYPHDIRSFLEALLDRLEEYGVDNDPNHYLDTKFSLRHTFRLIYSKIQAGMSLSHLNCILFVWAIKYLGLDQSKLKISQELVKKRPEDIHRWGAQLGQIVKKDEMIYINGYEKTIEYEYGIAGIKCNQLLGLAECEKDQSILNYLCEVGLKDTQLFLRKQLSASAM